MQGRCRQVRSQIQGLTVCKFNTKLLCAVNSEKCSMFEQSYEDTY